MGLLVASAAVILIVPVREDVSVLAGKLHVMVPALLPVAPDVIDNQLPPVITAAVQAIVPLPVLDTPNVVVPASLTGYRTAGVTNSTICIVGAWVIDTSTGLASASGAVTRMVAVRGTKAVLAVKLHVMVPVLVPLAPDVIVSQSPPEVTEAIQGMVSVPV